MTGSRRATATGPSPWVRVRTAILDRLAAVLLLPVIGPLVLVLAWWVRRAEGPPACITLDRTGRDGATFRMWKLRTMRAEAPDGRATGAVLTAVADDRVTASGARLRRWRADELPQILNVLRGEMAFIGPRPETPSLVDATDPQWRAVLAARPGITGPTQLVVEQWESAPVASGTHEDRYRDEILPVKLAVDRWYVERATPLLDLQVAWSMVERFVLGRADTSVQARVRREVPEAARVPERVSG